MVIDSIKEMHNRIDTLCENESARNELEQKGQQYANDKCRIDTAIETMLNNICN